MINDLTLVAGVLSTAVSGGLGAQAFSWFDARRRDKHRERREDLSNAAAEAARADDERHLSTKQLIEGLLAQTRVLQQDMQQGRDDRAALRRELSELRQENRELREELGRCEDKHESVERELNELRRHIQDAPVQPVSTAVTIINTAPALALPAPE